MPASKWVPETKFFANQLTILRGTVNDIVRVGVFHSLNPAETPTPAQFTTVALVDPPDPLAEGNRIDVLALIGPDVPADLDLGVGAWQHWVLIETNTEKMIFKVDLITVNA